MFAIIGIVVVFGAIIGGYLLERGNLLVLMQPAELIIIGGAAAGTLLIANPVPTIIVVFNRLAGILKPSAFTKALYLDTLKLLYELFANARKGGMAALESNIEKPAESPVFSNFPTFLANHHALNFVCDTLRTYLVGSAGAFELDQLMELDLDVQHEESEAPVLALSAVAESLPGLGIVAAVLGVVVTMGALGGPPEEIGHKVAAALVGTFLGILLCYGLVGPLAANMSKQNEEEACYMRFLRAGLHSFVRGDAPIVAVEYARRCIQTPFRPTFQEAEAHCRSIATAPDTPEEAAA